MERLMAARRISTRAALLACALLAPPLAAQGAPIDLSSQEPSWSAVIGGKSVCGLVRTSFGFAALTDGRMVCAFTEDGETLWQKSVPGRPLPILRDAGADFLACASSDKRISLVNPGGRVVWTKAAPFVPSDFLGGRDGRLFVFGESAAACYGTKGARKWTLETPARSAVRPVEMNDGSVAIFLRETAAEKSRALRVSPFGETLGAMEFAGIVASAEPCGEGLLLAFSGGGAGLCAIENGKVETRWSFPARSELFADAAATPPIFIEISAGKAALIVQAKTGLRAAVVRTKSGEVAAEAFFPSFAPSEKIQAFPTNGGFAVAGERSALFFSDEGEILREARLPPKSGADGWTHLGAGKNGTIVLCRSSWAVDGWRATQRMGAANKSAAKKRESAAYLGLPRGSGGFGDALRLEGEIPREIAGEERAALLRKGMYGAAEKKWAADMMDALSAYMDFVVSPGDGERENPSAFASDIIGTRALVAQIPLYESAMFSRALSRLIAAEKDKSRLAALAEAAGECGRDADGSLVRALDGARAAAGGDEGALIAICGAICEICRFMGRGGCVDAGLRVLSGMTGARYSSQVRAAALKALKKIGSAK